MSVRPNYGGFTRLFLFLNFILWNIIEITVTTPTQYDERIVNKSAKTINKTFTGLKVNVSGVQNIFRHPSQFGQHRQNWLSCLTGWFYALNFWTSYKTYSELLKHALQSVEAKILSAHCAMSLCSHYSNNLKFQ